MAPQAPAHTSQTFSGPSPSQGVSCRGLCSSAFVNDNNYCATGKQAELIKGYVSRYDFTFSFARAFLGMGKTAPVCHLCWLIIFPSAAFFPLSPWGKEPRESALARVSLLAQRPPVVGSSRELEARGWARDRSLLSDLGPRWKAFLTAPLAWAGCRSHRRCCQMSERCARGVIFGSSLGSL